MTEAVAKKKKRKPGTKVADGIEMPTAITRYRVMRCESRHPFPPRTPCALPRHGMRVDSFDAKEQPPSTEWVKREWGSGAYRFAWFEGSTARGVSPPFIWDDPAFPQKPEYAAAIPGAAEGAPAQPAQAPPAPNPMVELLKSQADGSGKVDLATTLVFLQASAALERQQRNEAEVQHRRWREEDERRATARQEDHRREIEVMRQRALDERASQDEFWQRQNEAAAELRRAARGEDVDDELGDLGDAVRALAAAQAASAAQTQDVVSKVIEMVKPAVPMLIQRFAGSGAPNGGK